MSCVFFDYGHESAERELHCARRTTLELGLPFEPVNISGLKYLFFGLLPTDYHPMMAECKCNDPASAHAIASTYAILRGVNKVLVGTIKNDVEQNSQLPQYLKGFSESMSALHGVHFELVTPFLGRAKTEVIELGASMGVNYRDSWACYTGDAAHCGQCNGCQKHMNAFAKTKAPDPAVYRKGGAFSAPLSG